MKIDIDFLENDVKLLEEADLSVHLPAASTGHFPSDFFFSPEGDKLFLMDPCQQRIYVFVLSKPFSLNGMKSSFSWRYFPECFEMRSMNFSEKGNRFFFLSDDRHLVVVDLNTAWKISSGKNIRFLNIPLMLPPKCPRATGFFLKNEELYVVDNENRLRFCKIFEDNKGDFHIVEFSYKQLAIKEKILHVFFRNDRIYATTVSSFVELKPETEVHRIATVRSPFQKFVFRMTDDSTIWALDNRYNRLFKFEIHKK